jgi:hypothetical protein
MQKLFVGAPWDSYQTTLPAIQYQSGDSIPWRWCRQGAGIASQASRRAVPWLAFAQPYWSRWDDAHVRYRFRSGIRTSDSLRGNTDRRAEVKRMSVYPGPPEYTSTWFARRSRRTSVFGCQTCPLMHGPGSSATPSRTSGGESAGFGVGGKPAARRASANLRSPFASSWRSF